MEPASFNPAVAGNSDLTCVSGTYRNQWEGLDRDPNTSMLTAHSFVDALKGGVLLSFYQDALGQETNTMARLGYAYHLEPLSNGAIVSLGLSASMFSKTLGNDWIYINGPVGSSGGATFGDGQGWDPAIPQNGGSASVIDLDFGLFIRKPGSFYAGLSATHLLENDLENFSIQPRRHIYAMGGYDHPLDGDYLVLRTNVLAKTDLSATIADINVNVLWDNMIWAGLSWRPTDAIAPTFGVEYAMEDKQRNTYSKQVFRLGYSYDTTTSELRNYSSGSHEVFLSYCFKFESIPVKNRYANPRFL
jgi:type IX secretion system PorP/SprF family membrane protein